MTKITILWSHWSGFSDACARALVEEHGCQVTIGYIPPEKNSPYAIDQFFRYPCHAVPVDPFHGPLPDVITCAETDILLVCGWHMPAYRRFSVAAAGRSTRVICMDNQWLGTPRQWLGVLASSFYIRAAYDAALVAGRRQMDFARRLGFAPDKIYEGHCTCDFKPFANIYAQRKMRSLSRSFVFVGRLAPEKGIATLLDAWEIFAASDKNGWRLKIIGGGEYPCAEKLPTGVEILGFVQPSALPQSLLGGDVFVLPSEKEPWGIVIQEAAATGMPIICSDACGAGDAFVENGSNGFIVRHGNVSDLVTAFRSFSSLEEARLRDMGARSVSLAGLRTPSTWAATVVAMMSQSTLKPRVQMPEPQP